MSMKKNISKALAMAVMMSVLAGQAYAADTSKVILAGTVDKWEDAATSGVHVNVYKDLTLDEHSSLYEDSLYFFDKDSNTLARYGNSSIKLGNIKLDTTNGLDMGGLDITNVNDLTVNGAIHASASGAIASGDTGLVNGGAVYAALEGKVDAADVYTKSDVDTKLAAKANAADVYTKSDVDTKLDAKANAADVYSKSETDAAIAASAYDDTAIKADIAKKADQTALDDEKTAREDADKDLQKQIDAISGGASTGMSELTKKINATDARVDRVGATAAALAGIHYQPMAKGQSQVAIGMGGYNGKKATALGLAYQISDRISGSVAGAANGSEHMFNVGFNYLFGQHSAKDIAPMAASNSVSLKEAELQAQVDSLNDKVARLEAMVKALAAK